MKEIILIGSLILSFYAFAGEQIQFKSGNSITEKDNHYEFVLQGQQKIPDNSFNVLWDHFPYPIESISFQFLKTDCLSILNCHSSDYLRLSERHVTGHIVNRHAIVNYLIQDSGDGIELSIRFENQTGQQLSHTFYYLNDDVIHSEIRN